MDPNDKRDFEHVVMMGDSNNLILLKADFSDKSNIKGTLLFKCPYRAVLDARLDLKDKKLLCLEL